MLYRLKENRVWRSYAGGSRIDALIHGTKTQDSMFPEDWLASTVRAFNPGREHIVEGLGETEDGIPITEIAPSGLPILVKLLDAAQRLVVQVHPTRAFAREAWNSPVGKTECWYVLQANDDACVYIGFREGITKEAWIDVCERQDIPAMLDMLHCFHVRPHDCVFVPGGVPHAIGGGCLLLETQEPSDLIVVPERVTPAGLRLDERKLHGGLGFSRMYDCFVYEGLSEQAARAAYFHTPESLRDGFSRLIDGRDNGIFSVWTYDGNSSVQRQFHENFAIAVITEGNGILKLGAQTLPVCRGDRLLLTDIDRNALEILPDSALHMVMALPALP